MKTKETSTYKTKGLEFYITNAYSKSHAVKSFIHYRIGVTENNIELFEGKIPDTASVMQAIETSNIGIVEVNNIKVKVKYSFVNDNEIYCETLEETELHSKGYHFYTSYKSIVGDSTRKLAMKWWNPLDIIEKSLLAQKYSDMLFGRGYVSLTGREIEEIWLKENINNFKTNQKALDWWNQLLNGYKLGLAKYYFNVDDAGVNHEEIEEIYDKEILEPKRQEEWQEAQVNQRYSRPNKKEIDYQISDTEFVLKQNQKQYKQFDESLFKAYIDKIPHEETGTMIGILSRKLNKSELTEVIEALSFALNYK